MKKVLDQAAKQLPGVKVRIGRMSDFADAILAEKPDLPVVRGDAPDSWIHGPMSDPAGARLARNTRPLITVTEALNTQLRAWGLDVPEAEPTLAAAYEQSLLYGEHTWGGSCEWVGRNGKHSYGEEFKKDRAQGRFQRSEASWEEHTGYIQQARNLIAPVLEKNLEALAQAVNTRGRRIVVYNPLPWKRDDLVSVRWEGTTVAALRPVDGGEGLPVDTTGGEVRFVARDLPPMGYRTYVQESKIERQKPARDRLETPFFKAKLDLARGVVCSLVDKRSGRELVDGSASVGLGQYLYERFDSNQVRLYCRTYTRGADWTAADFGKPGLPTAEQCPYQAVSPENFKLRLEQTPVSVTAVMEAQGGHASARCRHDASRPLSRPALCRPGNDPLRQAVGPLAGSRLALSAAQDQPAAVPPGPAGLHH